MLYQSISEIIVFKFFKYKFRYLYLNFKHINNLFKKRIKISKFEDKQKNVQQESKSIQNSIPNIIEDITSKRKIPVLVKSKLETKYNIQLMKGNQVAQSKSIKLVDGRAIFNQTLKLNISMYFDTTTNKFVQKKCIYNFLIITEKGEKSAGNVTYDLAEFFNKRIYQIDQSFLVQKCPVKDTKVDMKIYYQQSVQGGFDSMSQISMSSQMDTSSNNALDMSDINNMSEQHSQQKSQKSSSTVQALKTTSPKKQTKVFQNEKKQQRYQVLNESDIDQSQTESTKYNSSNKINQRDYVSDQTNRQNNIGKNIKGIEEVTHKINDFVCKFKQNLGFQMQEKNRKINKLSQQVLSITQNNKKLQTQLKQQKTARNALQVSLVSTKSTLQQQLTQKGKRIQQLQRKLQQQRKTNLSLQTHLSQVSTKGSQQGQYIKQLKQTFQKQQSLMKSQIQQLKQDVTKHKNSTIKSQFAMNKTLEDLDQLRQKYQVMSNKYQNLRNDMEKRENDVQNARVELELAVQNLVDSLTNMI